MLWQKRRNKRKGKKKLILYIVCILSVIFGLLLLTFRPKELQLISPVPSQQVILGSIEKNVIDRQQETKSMLQAATIVFSTVTSSQSSIIIKLDGGADAILSDEKDISEQVSSLQGILSRLTMEGKKFRLLDLRFSKPIIQFE
ncbi:MAG: hypothetical protein HYT11_02265 [Candidatus Levybacteria bacterium]|nr:hypothetical protein [Candidatus Levybacteria bacterium]